MDLDLTKEEIIVLAGLLKRYSDSDTFVIEDQAEQRALWNLECVLEKVVGNLYNGDWTIAHSEALDNLRDEVGANSSFERENGRIALWLEPSEVRFLLSEWRKVPESESESIRES